jgi:hypothetical protein
LGQSLGDLINTIGADMAQVAAALIDDLLVDLADPDELYNDLTSASGLEAIAQQIDAGLDTIVEDAFNTMDGHVRGASPAYVEVLQAVLGQKGLLTVDLQVLADLLRLFGIGSVSDGKVGVDADDAIFLPLAVVTWVTVYMKQGVSIDDIGRLFPPPATAGRPDVNSAQLAAYAHLGVDFILTELIAGGWTIAADLRVAGKTATPGQKLISTAGAYLNGMRWLDEIWYLVYLR